MADVVKGEMIRGQIDTVILLALTDGDKDSNDIRIAIEEKSDNQYSIKQGTFYSAMQRLVKQGLIKEYRSSALDGIRRKYYSLTAKGTKYLDKNREQWSFSKALVDNLIDAEPVQAEPKPEKAPAEPTDEFNSFKAFVENSNDSFDLSEDNSDDSYFDVIGADVLNDLNSELTKLEASQDEAQAEATPPQKEVVIENAPLPSEDEKPLKIEENTSDFVDDYASISNRTKDELFSFELDEEDEFESLSTPEEEQPCEALVQEEATAQPTDSIEQPIKDETPLLQAEKAEEDDLLIVEDFTPTNRNKYKSILNSILPKEIKFEKEEKQEKEDEPFEQVDFNALNNTHHNESYTEAQQRRALELEKLRSEPPVENYEIKHERVDRKQINSDPSDFSDLYAMANREGFKIKTSHNTNKFSGSGILINKLRMQSALTFFILLFIEALVLNFALSSILEWKTNVKLIILGCLAVYPVITVIMYLLNSKRVVSEISQFKDAMGVALIITFQMAIIILCVSLFVSVDFNNFKEVSSYILLPFILALNVPIYFILKYSLLSTGKYFNE